MPVIEPRSANDTIMVTGAAGLVGRAVLAALQEQGRRAIGTDLVPPPGSNLLRADVGDTHRLYAIARSEGVSSIIHCAAVSGPMVLLDQPASIVAANVGGTANVLELARVMQMRRLVFCSSTSAYGPTEQPADGGSVLAEVPLRPTSVYGATKAACEQLLAGYRLQHGLDAVSIRLSWVYGPGRTTACVIRDMISDAQSGRQTVMGWGADFPRQFIHVSDAARALLAAHDAPAIAHHVYAATGGTHLTLGAVADVVRKVLPGARIDMAPGPDPLDDYQHRFDIAPIRRDLGFAPQMSLEDGIRQYADYLADPLRSSVP